MKHLPYGSVKRGSAKLHPHNECCVCAECGFSKTSFRMKSKKKILEDIREYLQVDVGESINNGIKKR